MFWQWFVRIIAHQYLPFRTAKVRQDFLLRKYMLIFLCIFLLKTENRRTFASGIYIRYNEGYDMKRSLSLFSLVLFFTVCFSSSVWAWGQKGHRIVAQVAYQYMSKRAIKQVDKVLGKHGMVYWSNWPDEIKSDTELHQTSFSGHYQDLPGGLTDEDVLRTLTDYPTHGGNLWRLRDSVLQVLRTHPSDHDALVFLVHLTGDSYCPMHLGHEDDLGGNKVKMRWFGEKTNLHRVWDQNLIESQGYSYTEYAQYLCDKFVAERQPTEEATVEQMVLDTYHLTQLIYSYQNDFDGSTYHYIYRWHTDCERQLYRAGVRLAKILNDLYR